MAEQASATGNENVESKLAGLRSRWEGLSKKAGLDDAYKAFQQMSAEIEGMDSEIAAVRKRGYAFGGDWEKQAATLRSRWPTQKRDAENVYTEKKQDLQNAARQASQLLARAERDSKLLDDLGRGLSELERQITSAEERLKGAYAAADDMAGDISVGIEQAIFVLDELDDATFKLLHNEHPVAACKAQWVNNKEEPEGILYLTDQRILFEQEEEKATKKILFITTKKELVQQLLWEAPVGVVERASAEDKGGFVGFGVKELLTLEFSTDAAGLPKEVTLRFLDYADNELWQELVQRVKSGEIQKERFGASAQTAAPTAPREIPTNCPRCNAALPTIYKGTQQITCEYCGATVNVG